MDGISHPKKKVALPIRSIIFRICKRSTYQSVDPTYSLRYTIPDKKIKVIMNNESLEIIRSFNSEFNEFLEYKYKGGSFLS